MKMSALCALTSVKFNCKRSVKKSEGCPPAGSSLTRHLVQMERERRKRKKRKKEKKVVENEGLAGKQEADGEGMACEMSCVTSSFLRPELRNHRCFLMRRLLSPGHPLMRFCGQGCARILAEQLSQ